MKLLITLDFPPEKGGIQRYLDSIVRHTFSPDDNIFIGCNRIFPLDNHLDSAFPCPVHRIHSPCYIANKKWSLLPLFFMVIVHIIRHRCKPTIYAGNIFTALIPGIISFILPVHYHVYTYGTELLPLIHKKSLFGLFARKSLQHADVIYYLTGATRELLEHCIGSLPSFTRFPPKIEKPSFPLLFRKYSNGEINLLSVGRLIPHKGHRVLLDSVSILPEGISWKLTLIGNGPEYELLNSIITRNGLENCIKIETDCSDEQLHHFYEQGDIFILPSLTANSGIEGFGIVLLEAMAHGNAIIASKSGGIIEVFEGEEQAALLIPENEPVTLKNAIVRLIQNPALRKQLIYNGRRLLEERYVWN